jgi:hypothetical protein
MRLTVGPHPAAVYWRRRGVVLAGLAIAVLIVFYACTAATNPDAGAGATGGHSPSPTPTTTLLHPTIARTSTPTTPPPTAFTLPGNAATGDCTDAEIALSATAATASTQRGQPVEFTIRIRNVSSRTCVRDIGADRQELRLLDPDGSTIVWSSDDCGANHGHDAHSFGPGAEVSYTLTWNGRRSRGSASTSRTCTSAARAPDPGAYGLVARLDRTLSTPYTLTIRA